MQYTRRWAVFTKPWKHLSAEDLGAFVSGLGFDSIEFPLRPGYQVDPENAEKGLPALSQTLGAYGVKILSVATEPKESAFAACQAAGIKLMRIMAFADRSLGYLKSIERTRKTLDALVPLCERYGMTVGVQHHFGYAVSGSMELRHLLEGYDPKHIAAIWDAAHSALAGEDPAQALDILWDKLCLVNLKMAYYRRMSGPEARQAIFKPYFTTGRQGAASWKEAADYLLARGYAGDICMPAEYTDEANVEAYLKEDLAYARSLFTIQA